MEFPPPSPPPRALPAWRRPAVLFAAIALLLYGILLAQFVNACAGGSDSSGYLNHARILASGHVHIQPRLIPGLTAQSQSPFLYSPLGIKPAPDGDGLVATYPTGLPLLILAARPLGGWAHAGDVVMVLHGVAGLALTWALGALLGVPSRWRALGAALLAACPLYLDYSLQAMSDVPAMVWAAAAALAGWRARERTSWALAAGAALSIAVLVRPNNVLMAAPLCVAWWPERLAAAELRRLAGQAGLLVLGGVPGGIFFCLHGLAAYGSALTTGYGDSSTLFHSQVLGETLLHYARWLPALLSPGVCLFLLLPWSGRPARRQAAFLGAWALAYLAFYSCYQFTHETWWYLRFLLPAAPPLILGAMLAASRLARIDSAVFLVLAALLLTEETYWDLRFKVLYSGKGEAAYSQAAQWLEGHVPPDAILATMQTSGALFYYTDYTLIRWDQIEPAEYRQLLAAAAAAHRSIYAPLFDFETVPFLQRMPGRWKIVAKVPRVTIWEWTGASAAP